MPSPIPPSAASAGTIDIGGDLTVNRLGFGAMRVTGQGVWGEPPDREEAKAVIRRAVDLDVTFIDTADSYGPDVSEQLIAAALYPYPEHLVIATKGGLVRPAAGQWEPDGRPEHLREALLGSLRKLMIDRIDLYQLHRPDPKVPFEESLGELVRMKDEGLIRHIGLSNVSEGQIDAALAMTPIASVQNRYNLDDRSSEGVLDRCELEGIAFLPWAPIQVDSPALQKVADRLGATSRQVALAWLLARSPVMVPIPGTGSVEHLEANVAAAAIELSPEDLELLGAA